MKRKIIILLFLTLFLSSCTKKEKPFKDAKDILSRIESSTNLEFSQKDSVNFDWNYNLANTVRTDKVSGWQMSISNLDKVKQNRIDLFFSQNDFLIDGYNVSSGTIVNLKGYKKDQFICLVLERYESNLPDIYIQCGQLDKMTNKPLSKIEAIKDQLATQYNTDVQNIIFNIKQETSGYIRGVMQSKDWHSKNDAVFAANINEEWKLVFSGPEPVPCVKLADFNFPEDMIQDCANEEEASLKREQKAEYLARKYIASMKRYEQEDLDKLSVVSVLGQKCVGCYKSEFLYNLKSGQTEKITVEMADWKINNVLYGEE